MNAKVTYRQVADRLQEQGFDYAVLDLQDGAKVIVSQRGGRIFGPFLSEDGECSCWINDAFADRDAFERFLSSDDDWNLGGERVYIAPESQYYVRDRSDLWGSYFLPEVVDPGRYALSQTQPGMCVLHQEMVLEALNIATGQKALRLERVIQPAEDPLRYLSDSQDLMRGVTYAGYQETTTLSEHRLDQIMSQVWSILQIDSGGVVLIPSSPRVEVTTYQGVADDSVLVIHPHHVELKVTGDREYKFGLKATHVFGRVGYLNALGDGRASLIVRSFFSNPSAAYVDEPSHLPGQRGDSVQVYNDNGDLGGFGELECFGQAIGGATGRSSASDHMSLWLYVGDTDKVKEITTHLLGIGL